MSPPICGPVVQLVRTLACHARGRRFEPVPGRHKLASVAQLVEQGTENPRVIGSIPIGGTINAGVAHLVERHLAKVEVASSSLVARSRKKRQFSTEDCRFFLFSSLLSFRFSLFFQIVVSVKDLADLRESVGWSRMENEYKNPLLTSYYHIAV